MIDWLQRVLFLFTIEKFMKTILYNLPSGEAVINIKSAYAMSHLISLDVL